MKRVHADVGQPLGALIAGGYWRYWPRFAPIPGMGIRRLAWRALDQQEAGR